MTEECPKSPRNRPWRLLLGLLCCVLVAFGSTVQVAHSHPGGDITHADCAFCATAHVVAQTAGDPTPAPVALVVVGVREIAPQDRPARASAFALFTRPPPVDSTAA